ncbi:MAG: sodium-independent anion transporter [Bacteroidetes bacterium]|jgi:anti-anti-sigma regulatory factor|nr:sodium-independent anion transporter [Bacteroidota bacterium]
MEIKISTKEKFTVLTPVTPHLTDTLTEQLIAACTNCLNSEIKNVILNLQAVTAIDVEAANNLTNLQQQFYENNVSFVICEMKPQLEDAFDKLELLEVLNATPTESEAWDIVQIEEIERELMDGEDAE